VTGFESLKVEGRRSKVEDAAMPHEISPRELAAKLSAGESVYVIDVRQPWENQIARLPVGILIPLNELTARLPEIDPPDGALVVTYCHHGVRSFHAAVFLESAGLPGVASLAGGIEAWSAEVDPTVPRY
jgi:adenylyltransferase/sulfurtransferase